MRASKHLSALLKYHLIFILLVSVNIQTALANTESFKPFWLSPATVTMNDLTSRFSVTIPSTPTSLSDYVLGIQVAVIPIDDIGMATINWNATQHELTTETEKQFETDLYNCVTGTDASVETTKKKLHYCERIGYGEGSAGHMSALYYCAFVKGCRLVIVELSTNWVNCLNYGTAAEIAQCKTKETVAKQRIETFFHNIVNTINIVKL
jgi:hypothetical protein